MKKKVGMTKPTIIPRAEHTLSRKSISPNALRVLYRLKDAGAQAYLVGGGVRDILLAHHPKDFDIVTNLMPEEVKALFRNCRLIGRRFRLAHVHFGREIIEVATFRNSIDNADLRHSEHGMILRDNVYGTLEQDIWRRDFTVNALYYNLADFSVVDFCQGMRDLTKRTIRLIGDPEARYREDPLRLLRAVRFGAKLQFKLATKTEKSLFSLGYLLEHIPGARLFDEFLKLFFKGHAVASFTLLQRYALFQYLFPQTSYCLTQGKHPTFLSLIEQALRNTDQRLAEGKKVTPGFLIAAFLWQPIQAQLAQKKGLTIAEQRMAAIQHVLYQQKERMVIPRHFTTFAQEVWLLQPRLERIQKKHVLSVLHHPRFRGAYDFLLLRATAGEPVDAQALWWTQIQTLDEKATLQYIQNL